MWTNYYSRKHWESPNLRQGWPCLLMSAVIPYNVKKNFRRAHKLKIQDGGGRHLKFRKYVNNFGLYKDILHQIIWEDAPRPCGYDHVTKSRNRKLIRVTSSNECLKHMCVDLSDYNIYLNQIWHITQIPHYHSRNGQIHINWKSKMAAAAVLNFREMSITLDWI